MKTHLRESVNNSFGLNVPIPSTYDERIKYCNDFADYIDELVSGSVNEALNMLKADIEHRIKVTSVQNVEPLSNGQYIKVPNMLSAIEDVRKRINE